MHFCTSHTHINAHQLRNELLWAANGCYPDLPLETFTPSAPANCQSSLISYLFLFYRNTFNLVLILRHLYGERKKVFLSLPWFFTLPLIHCISLQIIQYIIRVYKNCHHLNRKWMNFSKLRCRWVFYFFPPTSLPDLLNEAHFNCSAVFNHSLTSDHLDLMWTDHAFVSFWQTAWECLWYCENVRKRDKVW